MGGIDKIVQLWHLGVFADDELDLATTRFRMDKLIFLLTEAGYGYASDLLNLFENKSFADIHKYVELHPPNAIVVTILILMAKDAQKKQQSKKATKKRHAASNAARLFIKAEWALHKADYAGNKSEFVRTYIGIVANRFNDANGDPLKITEKQMREVWLADTPSAGKQAG